MGLTKELLADYQNEEDIRDDNNRMLAEWDYAETQKPEQEQSFPTDVVDEDGSEIEFTPEQIEYIKDNLLSDSDWEFLGYNKPFIIPIAEVTDDILKRELDVLNNEIDEIVNNFNFIFKEY